jgi:hypothetical protein
MAQAYGAMDPLPPGVASRRTYVRRAWIVVDRQGFVRFARVEDPRGLVPNRELIDVVKQWAL